MLRKKNNSKFTEIVEQENTKNLENFFSKNKEKTIKDVLNEKKDSFVEGDLKNFGLYIRDKAKSKRMFQNEVAYKAGLSVRYGEKVFGGGTHPKRDTVLRLAFTMGLTLIETNRALRYANRQALYPKYERDAALIKLISDNKNITVEKVNEELIENGLEPLAACSEL